LYDPFEEVEQPEEMNPLAVTTRQLSRAMLWDMVGENLTTDPVHYKQSPASPDVTDMEYEEMLARKVSLNAFGAAFPLLCQIASDTASHVLTCEDTKLQALSDDERMLFRYHNYKLGTAITVAVITHMLQNGLITYGDPYELLGK
jgi:hypothetical protein